MCGSSTYRAAQGLRTHINEYVGVAEFAAISRLSGCRFAALLKSRIGYPALQYQPQLRMAQAQELLDTTDQSIAAAAAATGYPDSFYFPPVQEGARSDTVRASGAAERLSAASKLC